MYSLENMQRISYPSDLVMDLTNLYRFKGKDFYYEDIFKTDMQTIIKDTIEKDTFFAAKVLNLQITENRSRLIIQKNSTPKTNDEKILANLKEVFKILQSRGNDLELTSNEFLALAKRIFGGIKEVGFGTRIEEVQVNLLREKKRVSLRNTFEELLSLYKKLMKSNQVEGTQLATNLFVDISNVRIFNDENEFMCLLIYYCLLFRERFNVFKYISFFELYLNHEEEFKSAVVSASFNWETGFAQTAILNRLTIQLLLKGYNEIESKRSIYSFDKSIKKIESVESSILKMGNVFTKEEIRIKNPYLSDSTINRALENLKKENKIRPNGTGRSATWIRIIDDETFDPNNRQVSIFDYLGDKH
ncbi:MAG: hypothetical protein K2K48_00455 [Anaeroplasmataceae bacterium]|nr:hypothetical protein [Anaeroplasmataceae bacterium]MDE6413868.1 hypothetical protein [Anaeroplasmataceae bacterium]